MLLGTSGYSALKFQSLFFLKVINQSIDLRIHCTLASLVLCIALYHSAYLDQDLLQDTQVNYPLILNTASLLNLLLYLGHDYMLSLLIIINHLIKKKTCVHSFSLF